MLCSAVGVSKDFILKAAYLTFLHSPVPVVAIRLLEAICILRSLLLITSLEKARVKALRGQKPVSPIPCQFKFLPVRILVYSKPCLFKSLFVQILSWPKPDSSDLVK
jgi:hypothetical protein